MGKDLIIALDFEDKRKTFEFMRLLSGSTPFVKIGMELFYREGPSVVAELKDIGCKVFLDLKLHDIPNTVKKAMINLGRLGVDITNVHAAGGSAMMAAAREGLDIGSHSGHRASLIAVTQLTSTTEEQMHRELLICAGMEQTVGHYALNAKSAGLDGVVCSPLEARHIKTVCGGDFLTVTPGIRRACDAVGDQARVTTPRDARAFSDYIVVGRPITASSDPLEAYLSMRGDFLND